MTVVPRDMEPMIAVLAPHVIDQIAAGEVIERPASVVKELVDNAIDAGAHCIAIDVAAGGRTLVRVTDDGCGMSAAAARLALQRHATSKLREVDDLWAIASMGFRGEALPSIASVSRMTLTTRRAGDDAATRLAIEAGRLVAASEVGAPVGTTVEVADLLHNLPARLKFLKGEATEASHVTELVAKVAMAYPRLHLKLRHNGRTALDVPPDRDGLARAQALLGPRIAPRLAPVSGEESGVRVTAYLAAPELAQTTARGVQLFVGRRPVRDRGLLHALAMGYGELVPRGRYPIAVVLVDVPAGAVDVNVHPQKLEVRFADPSAVAAAVRHVVQAGVAAARWRDESGGAGPVQISASVAPPVLPFDGRAATPLAERHAAEMKSRQVPLGFGAGAAPPPDRAASGSRPYRTSPGPSGVARDWVRELRDQTRAQRVAEEPAPTWGRGEQAPPSQPPAHADRSGGPREPRGGADRPGGPREPRGGADRPGVPSEPPARTDLFGDPGVPSEPPARTDRSGDPGVPSEPPARTDRSGDPGGPSEPRMGGARPDVASEPAARTDLFGDLGEPSEPPGRADRPGDPSGPPLARGPEPRSVAAAGPLHPAGRAADGASVSNGLAAQLRYLGQLDLTYLVCEADGELVLVDQHAAHERVELARLRARHHRPGEGNEPRVAVQKLLFPTTLDATPAQLARVASVAGVLAQVGFEVEPFGKTTLAIKAVPAALRHGDPAQLVRRLLDTWDDAGAPGEAERLDALLGEIACHSAVRAGDRLAPGEAEALLRSLDGVDLALPAPHGRAVLLRLPLSEIGRRFGR